MIAPPLPNMPTATKKPAGKPPQYSNFVDFTEQWLLPVISVRLDERIREGTWTWCRQWWCHRAASVRFAQLHRAFEQARRRGTISGFLLEHVDPHMRLILDASKGPLHRCSRAHHQHLPALPWDPVPPGHFGPAISRPAPQAKKDDGDPKATPPRFVDFVAFTEQWLLPRISVRLTGQNREGTYTWCRSWWSHTAVAVRFAAIHKMFEAARTSDDDAMMSSLFVRHIDPHIKLILDAAQGPLYACTPNQHDPTPSLPHTAMPPAWFDTPGESVAVEDLGFGPDFRLLATATGPGR